MQVSKLSFSAETRAALSARPLTQSQRVKLRQRRVIEFIESKPAGTYLTFSDLAMAGGYTDRNKGQAGWSFINRMVKDGIIAMHDEGGPFKRSWSIPGHAVRVNEPNVVKVENSELTAPASDGFTTIKPTDSDPQVIEIDEQTHVDLDLMTEAKKFAWDYNSDSLRDFIKWLGGVSNHGK